MTRVLALAGLAALLGWAAFPPLGIGWLAAPSVALFMGGVLTAAGLRRAAVAGLLYGFVFIGTLMYWLRFTADEAVAGIVASQAPFYAAYAMLLWSFRKQALWELGAVAVGGWAALEFIRARVPVGGLEWGGLGYAVADWGPARGAAQWIGTSGWAVLSALVAAGLAAAVLRRDRRLLYAGAAIVLVAVTGGATLAGPPDGATIVVAIVQGNSPCPGVHCPDERSLIFENHLRLTETLTPGEVDLVVWPESATGFTTDPLVAPASAERIADQARRLGAYVLVGGDRDGPGGTFVNSNLLFDPSGDLVGEYRKQHPVPFGEYVPWRPVFGLIPETRRVPRDMLRGDGPVVFDTDLGRLTSLISFEGAFARYARDAAAAGGALLIVSSNESSYGDSPASDQFVEMTRMRAAESGVDLVHAAITGSSALITRGGEVGERTPLFSEAVVVGSVRLRDAGPTVYARFGDWLSVVAMMVGAVAVTWRTVIAGASRTASAASRRNTEGHRGGGLPEPARGWLDPARD